MRVCFVTDSYPTFSPFGGIARYTKSAAGALAARGHDVHVLLCVRGRAPAEFMDGPIRVHSRPRRWLPVLGRVLPGLGESIGAARVMRSLHQRHPFHAVEFPNWEGLGLISTTMARMPVAVRMHTSTAETVAALEGPPTAGERFLIWAERQSLRRADLALLHSAVQIPTLRDLGRKGPFALVPHGIPLPALSAPVLEGPPAVLCVGGLNPRKGAPTLLEAIPIVLARRPETIFQVVGSDPSSVHAGTFRSRHPSFAERVQFLGFVDDVTLDRLYERCTVYASASRYESFGLTFVEAMAHGKPVVGCRVGAIPEVTGDESCGRLVPPGDAAAFASAVIELLADPGLRERAGRAGRARAESVHTLERMGERLESAFAKLGSGALPRDGLVSVV